MKNISKKGFYKKKVVVKNLIRDEQGFTTMEWVMIVGFGLIAALVLFVLFNNKVATPIKSNINTVGDQIQTMTTNLQSEITGTSTTNVSGSTVISTISNYASDSSVTVSVMTSDGSTINYITTNYDTTLTSGDSGYIDSGSNFTKSETRNASGDLTKITFTEI